MAGSRLLLLAVLLACAPLAGAQARFDLAGPQIDIKVSRGDATLPISSVPNLQPGDTLWLHPQLPPTQSVHYLLIVAFLRGNTNPPPDEWFTRIETWNRHTIDEGAFVTVPQEAQQAVLFLAPETGGDFATLRSAVKGRPGIFVRAAQDLAEAAFEQGRIETYIAAMKQVPPGDPKALQEHSDLLARTLNLKPNPDCFKQALDQQYNCLTQSGSQMLLDDGHQQSILATLSGGDSANLIGTAAATPFVGGGSYSAYIGTIVDFVHIMSSLHTAKYQYIPAIAFPDKVATPESLNLKLNTPPSFNNPKSVIVIGLPPVEKAILPPLRAVDANHISCLLDPKMVVPVEGAPLVFSTGFAHDLGLRLPGKPAADDVPLAADAFLGGLVIAPPTAKRKELPVDAPANDAPAKHETGKPSKPEAGTLTGTIEGKWGFDAFTGPSVRLEQAPGSGWRIVTAADTNLIIGQPNHLQIESSGTACIRSVELEPGDAKVEWKLAAPAKDEAKLRIAAAGVPAVDLTLNLQHAATPGSIHLKIQQFGEKAPDEVGTRTFTEPAKVEGLQFHAGDAEATLTGKSLDQVKSVSLKDATFTPQCDDNCDGAKLSLALAKDAKAPSFKAGDKLSARVELKDGRDVELATTVLPPRPSVTLLNRRVTQTAQSPIELTGESDLPLGARVTFFLKSKAAFPRTEQVELANADESLHTTLSVGSGSLIMEDSHTVLASFDPLKTFGPSTFGPLRLRAVAPDGTDGDWIPLATIVRLPILSDVHCTADAAKPCQLNGDQLYLINAMSLDASFASPTVVPDGFADASLSFPRPSQNGSTVSFFVRLRDDPETNHPVTLPLEIDLAPPAEPSGTVPELVAAPPHER